MPSTNVWEQLGSACVAGFLLPFFFALSSSQYSILPGAFHRQVGTAGNEREQLGTVFLAVPSCSCVPGRSQPFPAVPAKLNLKEKNIFLKVKKVHDCDRLLHSRMRDVYN